MGPNNNPRNPDSGGMPALLPGAILIGIGALFLLDNLHLVRVRDWFDYWPVLLIALGLVKLVDSNHSSGRFTGAIAMGMGGLFLADNLGFLKFRIEELWPLLLIGAGLMMLWNRTGWRTSPWGGCHLWLRGAFRHADESTISGNAVHEFVIFSGSRRVVTTPDFQGGTISAIFGGVTLDLRGALMAGNTAVLNVSAIYGGISVHIPTTWTAEIRGAGVFGGFSDESLHPPVSSETKRLIVKGGAVFGGVTVKN